MAQSNSNLVEVREWARTYTTVAIKTLAALMLSKKSEDLTRYYAAEALLNRGRGRPATAITGEGYQLAVRPVFHQLERRAKAHLLVTFLGYAL